MYDEQLRKLIEQFRAKFLELSNEEIQRLIEETKAEALAEARAIIKEQMLQAILEQSARLQTRGETAQSRPAATTQPTVATQPAAEQPTEAPRRSPFETPRVTLVSRPETSSTSSEEKAPPSAPEPATVEAEQNGSEIDGARKILREIENLRQQLSANEEWLTRGSSTEDEADHAGA